MEANAHVWTDYIFNVYSLIVLIIIIVAGIFLGFKKKITVFRDYNDLGLVFLSILLPYILMYLLSIFFTDHMSIAYTFVIIVGLILFVWIVVRTYQDNNNILFMLIALITKTSLCFLFIFNLLSFVSPEGKNADKRRSVRYALLAFLLLLTPLILALVKNKEGIFNPDRTLSHDG